ncbi:hypothetical protein PPYR_03610 [Photinus pyralis]|uniref:FAM21/CAPZIP domain-containing protein n=2 Tax=Photinus pyralis TaxID=7054 RepID=A0A5N4A3A7_PHOPY|nr:hypothetical protein PPYR_03610 [Photinus pyralis]
MSSDTAKPWQRPWSTEEITKNAPNWSLAGDAGLLKHLESFSEKLLLKAEETNNNLNKLLSGLDNASLALDEAKNDFRTLRNTQFIESRVYEDDETVPQEAKTQDDEVHKQSKEEKVREVREAILGGIAVVERYFDKVEVPGSDSEDETDFTSFVLKPKDPYVDRPLPFVIGTDEWYKKWHVGLLDSSSESEDEEVSEKFSDSDSVSESSYNANKGSEMATHDRPVANSTFNESVKPPLDLFGDSDGDSTDVTSGYVSTAQRNFANELAAKLGNYVEEPEINRKPINAVVNVKPYGNLFSDEPPPIADDTQKGLFSGGAGLFDDLAGGGDLWDEAPPPNVEKSSYKSLFSDGNDLFSTAAPPPKNATGELHSRGLFDDDDDDLFNEASSKAHPAPYLPPAKTTSMPYFADEPPELQPPPPAEAKVGASQKPFGGVKLIDQSDLDRLRRGRPSSSESSDDIKSSPPPLPKLETPKKPKQLSLFDDDEEDDERALFEKDLFSTITSFEDSLTKITDAPRSKSKLFDEGDDLFATPVVNEPKYPTPAESDSGNIPPLPNVFDSNPSELDWDTQSDNVFEDGGLFDNVQEISSQRSGLFDSEPPSLFFESSGIVRDISTRVGNDESFSPHATSSRRFSTDIFSDQQSNDSFFVTKNKSQFEPHVQSNLEIIPETSYTQDGDVSESNLEITPSGEIDSLYTEATASEGDHAQSKEEEPVGESDSIFAKLSDSSGKIKHNLKINVGALLPGASPLKKKPKPADESDFVQPDRLQTAASEVLPSITKDRARISIKRRPSTRKGRQESLRNSVPDFSILSDDQTSKVADEPSKIAEVAPRIADTKPKIADDKPKIADDKPKIADDKPKIADDKPKIADDKPKIADDKPKIADDKPKIADDKPKIADDKPKIADSVPQSEFIDIFEENARKTFDDDFEDSPEKTDSNISVVRKVTSVVEASDEPKQPHVSSNNFESEEHKQLGLFDDDDDELDDIFSSNKLPPKSNILKESLRRQIIVGQEGGENGASEEIGKLESGRRSPELISRLLNRAHFTSCACMISIIEESFFLYIV